MPCARKPMKPRFEAMPFVSDFLEAARRQEYRMCVATASKKAQIQKALHRLGLLHYFQFVMDADEAGAAKTDPAIFLACASRLGEASRQRLGCLKTHRMQLKAAADAGFLVVGVHAPGGENKKRSCTDAVVFLLIPLRELLNSEKDVDLC